MKIDTLGIQAFAAIAEHGSFQKAAASLHLSQTALTRRLQNLEASLGVSLIERTTRSVALTRMGADFLPQAQRSLRELGEALQELRDTGTTRRGDIVIACVPTAGVAYLPKLLKQYAKRHPDNRVTVLDHLSSGVTGAVLRREAEFGLNIAESPHPDLRIVPLLRDTFVLACRDDHPLASRTSLSWRQLAPYPLVFAGRDSANRALLDQALGAQPVALRFLYEVQRSSTAIGLVMEGVAAAVVPRLSVQRGMHPQLRVVSLKEPVISRTLALVSRRAARFSPAAQALYDLIQKQAVSV